MSLLDASRHIQRSPPQQSSLLLKNSSTPMAKALAFSPQSQNFKNHILGGRIIRQGDSSILQRIRHPSLYERPKNFIHRSTINRNVENVLHAGRLPSVSAAPVPSIPDYRHSLRSPRRCLRLLSPSVLYLRRSGSPYLQFFLMSSQSESDMSIDPPEESTKTVKCMVKGRVQGVFYRNWTVENATQLGLKGWVRNRRDGSVEALLSGNPKAVDEMLQRCRRGPPDAMVTALEAVPCNEDAGKGFQRKPTV